MNSQSVQITQAPISFSLTFDASQIQLDHAGNFPLHLTHEDRNFAKDTSPLAQLHSEAVMKAKRFKRAEAELLEVLIRVDGAKLFENFERTSLYSYCVEVLDLPKHTAYNFIDVMRTGREMPEILDAIYSGKTTVSKIRKICSVVTPKSVKGWIDLTIECSARVVERAVAMANPQPPKRESLKYISGDTLEIRFSVSESWADLLEKTKDRISTRERRAVSTEEALFVVMSECHRRDDPVAKAERADLRKQKKANLLAEVSTRRSSTVEVTSSSAKPRSELTSNIISDASNTQTSLSASRR